MCAFVHEGCVEVLAQNEVAYVCMHGAMRVHVCACNSMLVLAPTWNKSMCVRVYIGFTKEWGDTNVCVCACRF